MTTQVTSELVEQFQDYANSFKQGYLKTWKASSILFTLTRDSGIVQDEVRFLAYLKNCLNMEGFRDTNIELIMGWLYERLA